MDATQTINVRDALLLEQVVDSAPNLGLFLVVAGNSARGQYGRSWRLLPVMRSCNTGDSFIAASLWIT